MVQIGTITFENKKSGMVQMDIFLNYESGLVQIDNNYNWKLSIWNNPDNGSGLDILPSNYNSNVKYVTHILTLALVLK